MKKMKRFAAIAAATVMAVSMTVATASFTAFAAGADISVTDAKANHTYTIYQIFTGTYSNGVLSNVELGSSVASTSALVTALKGNATLNAIPEIVALTDVSSAQDIADAMSKISSSKGAETAGGHSTADELATVLAGIVTTGTTATNGSFTNVENGYYLITDSITTIDTDQSVSRHILAVEGDTNITLKQSVPTVEKKVKDVDDTTGDITDWQDSSDMDIGDVVDFKLTGTLPEDYAAYDNYYYKFTDTLSAGLDFDASSVVVTAGDQTLTKDTDYTITTSANGFNIEITDLKTANPALTNASTVVVTYKATLNENAVIGATGNPNKVDLTYSNNPNKESDGTPSDDTGKTPEDTVIVFTYEADVNKVDPNGAPLTGANFALYKKGTDGNYSLVKEITTDTSTFEFKGIDAGEYKLVETKTPTPEYNKIDDVYFTVAATHDVTSEAPQLLTLTTSVTAGNATFASDKTTGKVSTTIENKKGSTLPETGGIGTKIFTVAGGTIVLGAGVLLITKKRMKKED